MHDNKSNAPATAEAMKEGADGGAAVPARVKPRMRVMQARAYFGSGMSFV